jgi:hypothetical protein
MSVDRRREKLLRTTIEEIQMPAIDIQTRLRELQAERVGAQLAGLGANGAYMADLDVEITEVRREYVLAALTEIASLRAELFGAQYG